MLLKRLGLLFASLLVVAGIGEIVARVFWGELAGTPVERPAPELPTGVSLESLPELEGVFDLNTPNQRGIHNGVYFRSNSLRMRGPEYERRAAPGVLRIAVVGDSVAMGSGVTEEAAYAARIGRLLEGARPGRKVEVINGGMSGLDARRIMGRRDAIAELYGPHVFVYGYTLNDIEGKDYKRLVSESQTGEFWSLAKRGMRSPSHLWRLVWLRVVSIASSNAPWMHSYRAEVVHNHLDNRFARATLGNQLQHLADTQRKPRPCALVFIHTRLDQLDEEHPFLPVYELVARMGEILEVPVAQSFPAFLGRRAETLWVGAFDPHPNEEAHRILAESLLEALLKLPEECLSPPR